MMTLAAGAPAGASGQCGEIWTQMSDGPAPVGQEVIRSIFQRAQIPTSRRQILVEEFTKILEKENDPYILWADVVKTLEIDAAAARPELMRLAEAMSLADGSPAKLRALDDWVVSESHAVFLYDMLHREGLSYHRQTLGRLLENNVYFVESVPLKEATGGTVRSLVTYSFEKEGTNPLITWMYRSPKFDEASWLGLGDQQRLAEMQSLVGVLESKTFLSAERVPPTSLKPRALGGYSVEVRDHHARMRGWSWEVAHKAYEISRERLMRSVNEVATFFKETHSFHLHVVFELPRAYAKFESFTRWFKHMNDYQYLRGLEEGLHGNYLTNIANDRRDFSWSERFMDWFWASVRLRPRTVVLETMNQLDRRGMKFFSAGLRAGSMYGKASGEDMIRVGVELRDTTRHLDRMNENVRRTSEAAESWRWERAHDLLDVIAAQTPRLTTSASAQLPSLTSVVSPGTARKFLEVEPTAGLPLTAFESGRYFNFVTGEMTSPTPAVSARLVAAREGYVRSLRNLEREMADYASRGERVENELVVTALRMSISEWAKEARASELYREY